MAEKEKEAKEVIGSDLSSESNKTRLRQQLEDIKADIERTRDKTDLVQGDLDELEQYKSEVFEIRYAVLSTLFSKLKSAIVHKDDNLLALEEARLRKKLENLFWLLDNRTDDASGEIADAAGWAFSQKVSDLLKPFSSNDTIKNFLENKTVVPYFKDTLKLGMLQRVLTKERISDLQADLVIEINKETERLMARKLALGRELDPLKELREKIEDKLQQDTSINTLAIVTGLPLFCFTIIFLFIGPGYIQSRLRNPEAGSLLAKSQDVLLDLSTVLLLTMSILILGLSGNINNEVLGALIGGISGYVLNKTRAA